jgi:hypothetical protein
MIDLNIIALNLKGWMLISRDVIKESKQYFDVALK